LDSEYTRRNIRKLIRQKGISQVELGNAIGVSQFVVSHWILGKSCAYMKYLDKIAKYLDVSMDYLTGNTSSSVENDSKWQYSEEVKNRKELRDLLDVARTATDEEVGIVTDILKILKRRRINNK